MDTTGRARHVVAMRKLSISPHILELLSLPCCLDDLDTDYRPHISEDLKIGFGNSDCATQTDVTETADLAACTTKTRALVEFTQDLHDDLAMYKNILKMQYEEKIQEQADKLRQEIDDRLQFIEDFYKEKEVRMRYSFQQQLCDALAILRTKYSKYFHVAQDLYGETEMSLAAKIDMLRNKLEESADAIRSLEAEILQYQEREKMQIAHEEEDIEKELLKQENLEFKEQMSSLAEKVMRLQATIKRKEQHQTTLNTEIRQMQERRERDLRTIDKLTNIQEVLKLELEREKQRVATKTRELKAAQEIATKTAEVAALMASKAPSPTEQKEKRPGKGPKERKEEAKEAAARVASAKEATVKEAATIDTLRRSKEGLLQEIYGDKGLEAEKTELQAQIAKFKKAEEEAKLHTTRFQQELRESSRCWEVKFEILKKSLHAIKDEMFLRQSLRKSAKYKRSSLSERSAPHLVMHSSSRKRVSPLGTLYMPYSPLPEINSQAEDEMNEEGLNIAKFPATVEIPSSSFEGETADEEDVEVETSLTSPYSSTP